MIDTNENNDYRILFLIYMSEYREKRESNVTIFFFKESVCNKYFENSKLADRDFDLCLFPLFRVLDIKGSRSERRMARASNVLTYHYLFLTP